MEIEVGEYGRTNLGKIIKFAWIGYSEGKKDESKVLLINNDILSNDFYYFKIGEKIVNHSKNIMDLIEVGDYVNGKEVKQIAMFEGFPDYPKLIFTDEKYLIPGETIENKDIKTIVTHEQMQSIEYKVEEEQKQWVKKK